MFLGYINNSEWMTMERQDGEGAAWRRVTVPQRLNSGYLIILNGPLCSQHCAGFDPKPISLACFSFLLKGCCSDLSFHNKCSSFGDAPAPRQLHDIAFDLWAWWEKTDSCFLQHAQPKHRSLANIFIMAASVNHKESTLFLLQKIKISLSLPTVHRLQIKGSPCDTICWAIWGLQANSPFPLLRQAQPWPTFSPGPALL